MPNPNDRHLRIVERRPAGEPSGDEMVKATTNGSVTDRADDRAQPRWRCRHLRERFCWDCVRERRRTSRELDALAGRERHAARPETHGLSDDELRAEAARLLRAGWTAGEVATRLEDAR